MNETLARSLSLTELADRYRDHDDPGARQMARLILDGDDEESEWEGRFEAAEEEHSATTADLRNEIESLKDLLQEVLDGDNPDEALLKRIAEAVR